MRGGRRALPLHYASLYNASQAESKFFGTQKTIFDCPLAIELVSSFGHDPGSHSQARVWSPGNTIFCIGISLIPQYLVCVKEKMVIRIDL